MASQVFDAIACAQKFKSIIDWQESERGLIERRAQLEVLQAAILARVHILLHGKPGVAKSMTTDGLLMHMPDLRLFKTQAYKASPPEQFLGPISLKQMAEDKFVRIVNNRMADCEVAFIDELPRAPRALLPALQGMMVEREFDSGDGAKHVPLMSLIGTSNHLPDDEELQAFFDRFALKLVVSAPQSQQSFVQIMQGALVRRAMGDPHPPAELMISRLELAGMQDATNSCHVPDAVLDSFGELWANLLGAGIEPSVRRFVDLTKVMQAVAVLDGRDEVQADDLQVAQHSLWTTEEEKPLVYAEVVKFASPWTKKRAELLDAFQETLDRQGLIQSTNANGSDKLTIGDKEKSLTDHAVMLVNSQRKLAAMIETHVAERKDDELSSALVQIGATKAWVQEHVLGGLKL